MSNEIPDIPDNWNLTDEQKASMKNAQQKVINDNNNKKIEQQTEYDNFMKYASMNPPQYPILVTVKDNTLSSSEKKVINTEYERNSKLNRYYWKTFFLKDSNNNYIYSNSFNDALQKVKTDLLSQNSLLQKQAKQYQLGKIRISSENVAEPPQSDDFALINKSYKYWNIFVTNAAESLFSNFRKTIRKVGGKKRKGSKKRIRKGTTKKSFRKGTNKRRKGSKRRS